LLSAFDLHEDPSGVVTHPTGQAQTARQTVNVGPEPHTLDDTLDPHFDSDTVLHRRIVSPLTRSPQGAALGTEPRRALLA
jgi:hypothetical protein